MHASTKRPPRNVDERTLLEHLIAAHVDPRRDVDHVLYGLYPVTDQGVRHALVIVGQFDPTAIERYLAGEPAAVARPVARHTAYEIRRTDPDPCDAATTALIPAAPPWT